MFAAASDAVAITEAEISSLPNAGPRVQAVSAATVAFLREQGIPVPDTSVRVAGYDWFDAATGLPNVSGMSVPGKVILTADVARDVARIRKGRPMPADTLLIVTTLDGSMSVITTGPTSALQTLTHELLHQVSSAEEGVIDAVAADLVAPLAYHITGRRVASTPSLYYPGSVAAVRRMSASATGTKWTSRASRRWRCSLLV